MESIDQIAHSNFFVGILGLLLKLKFSIYENRKEDVKDVLKNLQKSKKHYQLLKNFSPLAAYYITFYTKFYEFLDSSVELNDENVFDLYNTFEEFSNFRKFNKM
jgi:hypothetical protein